MPSVEKSLDVLNTGPVDLLLIHWPSYGDAIPVEHYMESLAQAQQRGLTRLIGVSNFTIARLQATSRLLGPQVIATNQIELNVYLQAPRLVTASRRMNIPLTAYLPIARGAVNEYPVITSIARKHGVSNAVIALAFLLAEGHIAIPASSNPVRLKETFRALEVKLTQAEMAAIHGLDRGQRIINPDKSPNWDD